jgi:SulP family sulfate permease
MATQQRAAGIPLLDLPAAALRSTFREGYSGAAFRQDVLAGLVVGIVALPLSMALSIAVGAPPQHGLYTAIIGGFVVAALGGSHTAITGPTAAFVVILAPLFARFGLPGLLVAGAFAGLILILLGLFRLGRLIEFVPYPVTMGFTAGIAVVIAILQVKDLLGLRLQASPDHFLERIHAMWAARGSANPAELGLGLATLAVLISFPRITRKVPAPLVALPLAAGAAWFLHREFPGFQVQTVGSRFQSIVDGRVVPGIPSTPPLPVLPWTLPGPSAAPFHLDFNTLQALLPGAFAIAMLGAIESLLCAVVADGMTRSRHDPDAELLALGVGNLLVPLFGGIPATGAIARTATSIRYGARSPVAAMVHAVTVLLGVLALAPLIAHLPMAALAALLLLVAWNMSEARHVVRMFRTAERADVFVLIVCFILTVVFDMVVAVVAGLMLAALLFMRRMATLTKVRLVGGRRAPIPAGATDGVLVYDIEGPLFFGAAHQAMQALLTTSEHTRAVVFDLDQVPHIDSTGLVALESALRTLEQRKVEVVLSGLRSQPRRLLRRAGLRERFPRLAIRPTVAEAIAVAEALLAAGSAPYSPPDEDSGEPGRLARPS